MRTAVFIVLVIFFSGVSVFFRKLAVDRIHPYQIQILAGILYGSLIPVWLHLMSKSAVGFSTNSLGNLYGLLCLVSYVLSAVILGMLLKQSNSTGTISALVSINPLVTLLLSILFLGEDFNAKKLAGCLIITVGIGLVK